MTEQSNQHLCLPNNGGESYILESMQNINRWLFLKWKLIVGLLVAIFVIACLIYIPLMQADEIRALVSLPREESLRPDKLTAKEYFEIENEARKTLAQIIGGLFVLIGIYLAFRRQTVAEEALRVTEETLEVSRRGQITDRFTKAIEQLGKDPLELRLGAIYGLEKIAHDSADYHWQVMEVLTAYVRDRYPWKEGTVTKPEYKVPLDLEAVMAVLRRRKHERETKEQVINLAATDLRKVNLEKANLPGASFDHANLQGAWLKGINLQKAWLYEAYLQRAMVHMANLHEAHFEKANLHEAWFSMTNLQGAKFDATNLQGANLKRAILSDCALQESIGLAQTRIDSAICNEKTILPEGFNNLQALENWGKFQEGQR